MAKKIGQETEVELAFLPKHLPSGLQETTPHTVTDIYLSPPEDLLTKIRLRNNDGRKFQLTKKVVVDPSDVSVQVEYNTPLTEDEYNLFATLPGREVAKDRYKVNIDGYRAEVDLFKGPLTGFVLVEFEFPNVEERGAFHVPEICGNEVTQEDFIAGAYLAGKTYEDISDDLARLNYTRLNYE